MCKLSTSKRQFCLTSRILMCCLIWLSRAGRIGLGLLIRPTKPDLACLLGLAWSIYGAHRSSIVNPHQGYIMSLKRSDTRFRPASSSRGATPDSGEDSKTTLSPLDSGFKKLRKRSWASLDDDAPLTTNTSSGGRDREGGNEIPRKTPRQSEVRD